MLTVITETMRCMETQLVSIRHGTRISKAPAGMAEAEAEAVVLWI